MNPARRLSLAEAAEDDQANISRHSCGRFDDFSSTFTWQFSGVSSAPLSGPCQNPPISFDRAVNQKLSQPLVPNPKLLHSNPGLTSWLPFLCRDQARLKLNRVQKATDRVVGMEAQTRAAPPQAR